jgi:prepilin-type N-terminal cleavage/methylation domain-containing protein
MKDEPSIATDLHAAQMLRRRGFSLIELVMVVMIVAVVGAIGIPCMSQGAAGANDSSLRQTLDLLRKAIDHFAAEHQGTYPSVSNFKKQLTKYTDDQGNVSNQNLAPYVYGPYLSAMPSLPVGNGGGQVGTVTGPGVGWIYDPTLGSIHANTTIEVDAKGVLYSTY